MNLEQKNTNLPMIVMKQLQHGGWYEYDNRYIGMEVADSALFVEFYHPRRKNLHSTAQRMDSLHRPADRNRNPAFRRPSGPPCPRRFSPLLSRRSLEHGWALENPGRDIDQNILSNRNHNPGSGRHLVSPQWQKDRWSRLVARRGPFDSHKTRFRLGFEPGGADFADSAAMGRRTSGLANQYEIASQKAGNSDRVGRADDPRTRPMASEKAVSSGCRRFLRQSGWKETSQHNHYFADTTQRQSLRSAGETKEERPRPPSQERQTSSLSAKDGQICSALAKGKSLRTGEKQNPSGLFESSAVVSSFARAHTSGYQSGSGRQRERRLSLYYRCDHVPSRGYRMLWGPLGDRRYVQKYQTISRRPGAADFQGPRAGTSRGLESVAVFDGLAVVLEAEVEPTILHGSSMESAEVSAELR